MCAISGMPTASATSSAMSSGTAPELPDAPQPDAHLDADDHVAVGVGDLHGVDRVHQAQLLALAHHDAVGEAVDAGVRHVQVGEDAHLARLDHVLAEAGEVAGPGAAGVDRGGDAGGAAELLRVDAERGAAPVDVGVQVDQAGRDDRSRHVAHVGAGAALAAAPWRPPLPPANATSVSIASSFVMDPITRPPS